MTPHPAVLLGLRADDEFDLKSRLEGWVRRCGYRTRFTADAREAISWLRREDFAASFVDSDLGLYHTGLQGSGPYDGTARAEGEAVWRVIRPVAVRRTVLLARDRRQDLWFEALRCGVATVLPLPPREAMVRAALAAATHAWGTPSWSKQPLPAQEALHDRGSTDVEDQAPE